MKTLFNSIQYHVFRALWHGSLPHAVHSCSLQTPDSPAYDRLMFPFRVGDIHRNVSGKIVCIHHETFDIPLYEDLQKLIPKPSLPLMYIKHITY